MTEREIRELRDKISTDPILTDEEIEYIWMAMDKLVTRFEATEQEYMAEIGKLEQNIEDLEHEIEYLREYW